MTRKLGMYAVPIAVILSIAPGVCKAQSALDASYASGNARWQRPIAGHLSANQNMSLVITLPLRNQDELDQFLEDVYDPSSPNFRQFLTVEQFTAQFSPTQADYDAVVNFAQGERPGRCGHLTEWPQRASVRLGSQHRERVPYEPGRLSASHREPLVLRAGPRANHEPDVPSVAHLGARQLFDPAACRPG